MWNRPTFRKIKQKLNIFFKFILTCTIFAVINNAKDIYKMKYYRDYYFIIKNW